MNNQVALSEPSFDVAPQPRPLAMIEATKQREASEIMASIAIAKRFPRDETAAFNKVITACRRPTLAELSQYEYSRGGSKVTGPSIHLAKAIASAWGNIEFGWRELNRQDGESTVEAFAWDKENNCRHSLVFNVKHWRDTKQGGYALKDERDIYELCANQAARRMRACILSIVPGDVVESALLECEKTLSGQNAAPLIDRVRKMAMVFQDVSVTQDMLERFLGCKLDACSEPNLARLRKIYAAIRDGVAKVEDHFSQSAPSFESAPKKTKAQPTTAAEPPAEAVAQEAPAKAAEKPVEPKQTPQDVVWSTLQSAGVDFTDFQSWLITTGLAPNADTFASVNDLPEKLCKVLLADNAKQLGKCVTIYGRQA